MLSMSQGAEHPLHILISTTRHQDDLTPSGERLFRVPTVEESIVPVRRGTIRPIYNIGNWAKPGHLTAIFQVFVLTGIEYSGLGLSVYMYKHVCIPWQSQSQEIMPAGELSSSPVNLEMFHSLRASLILGSVHAHTMRRSSDGVYRFVRRGMPPAALTMMAQGSFLKVWPGCRKCRVPNSHDPVVTAFQCFFCFFVFF